jgi:predicted acyltransferase
MSVAFRLGWLPFLGHIPHVIWPFDHGELPSIVMAGIVCSTIFLESSIARTVRRKLIWGAGLAAVLFAAGAICTPLGISKNRATPTWCLYSAAIGTVLFIALYWIADVKGIKRWAAFVKPAGSNTLLTYLLPDLFYYSAGMVYLYLPAQLSAGWPGAVRSVVFTALMLAAAAVLTRYKVRMQL